MNNPVIKNENETIRINRYLSCCGLFSRRKADEYILEGRVQIDGKPAQVADRVSMHQEVTVDGNIVFPENERIYIAFHKPLGVTCTAEKKDPDNVIDYLHFSKRIYPVGRLDKMSTGLLLLTNDGDMAYHLLRTGEGHEKEYRVKVNRDITDDFLYKMRNGVKIMDTVTLPCEVNQTGKRQFQIILTQGLNRQIRRMCEANGYKVASLQRIRVGSIPLGNLAPGKWRYLKEDEIRRLPGNTGSNRDNHSDISTGSR